MRALTVRPQGAHLRRLGAGTRSSIEGRFVFGRRTRRAVGAYVAVAVVASGLLAPRELSGRAYVEAMIVVSCICSVPGLVVAWRAAFEAPREDRLVWRLWAGGFAIGCVATVALLPVRDATWEAIERRSVGAALLAAVGLAVTNTLLLRARSGQRTVLIDLADIAVALVAVLTPLALLVAEPIGRSAAPWFAVSAAVWFAGSLYGTGVAVVLYLRVRPGERVVARYGIVFGAIALVSTSAHVVLGIHDFGLVAGPFLAAHALLAGFTVVFLVHATRQVSTGLERLPARAQVRRRPAITVLALVSIPVTGVLVWQRRGDDGALVAALVAAGALVTLFCIRSLLAARETRVLYRDVERSADERGELLSQVLARADADRHRAATQLHRQSVQLYTALTTVVEPSGPSAAAGDAVAARVAEHLRADLGRRSDDLRRVAQAVRPGEGATLADSFTTLVRAQLASLYPEGRGPRLVAEVDPDLELAWTDEAVLVRIAEQAFGVLSARCPDATTAELRLGVEAAALVLDLRLDGRCGHAGLGPPTVGDDDLAPVRAGAELLGGTVEVAGEPAWAGVRIHVPFGRPGPTTGAADAPSGRPHLRLVDGP